MIRVLRVKATGQWCGPAVINGEMPVDPTYADRVAQTLRLAPGSLEVVDAEDDPRSGELIPDPNVPPEPEQEPVVGPPLTPEEVVQLRALISPVR